MFNFLKSSWNKIFDERFNPLQDLPSVVRYQLMMVLALMWSFIFCAMIGWMVIFPYWAIGHVILLSCGLAITHFAFQNAIKFKASLSHRDVLRTADGKGTKHDDIWGG